MEMTSCPNCGRPFDGFRHTGDPCNVCAARENGMADPGRAARYIQARLEDLRAELRAERISYSELAELQGLAEHIEPHDVELLEAAGVPEHHDA